MRLSRIWRRQAHALKGMSLNLGATKLGNLCDKGQDSPLAPPAEKNELLKNIRAEYEEVRQFLVKLAF